MKKSYLFLLTLLVVLFTSCGSSVDVPEGMFLVKGKIENIADSSVVTLWSPMGGGGYRRIASDTIANGSFVFTDSVPELDDPLTLKGESEGFTYGYLNIWVGSKSYTEIKGKDGCLQAWNVESTIEMQRGENEIMKYSFPAFEKGIELSVERNRSYIMMMDKMRKRQDFSEERKKYSSFADLFDPIYESVDSLKLEYLKVTPVSDHWMFTYAGFAKFIEYYKDSEKVRKVKALYDLIPENYLSTPLGNDITNYIFPDRKVKDGETIPEVMLYDLEGKRRSLSEFKGKYTLLDFWSRACGPCVNSIPELKEVAELYKDKLSVVSISSDGEAAWKEAVEIFKLTGNQLNEKVNSPKLNAILDISGIPGYIFLSPEGVVESRWSGYDEGSLKRKLEELLK